VTTPTHSGLLGCTAPGPAAMASGGSEEPLLRDEDVPQEPPTGKRRSSIDVVEAGAPTTPQLTAPLSGWAARVYAYRACFFVMAAMTGVSFVYGGFSAVVAVYLHDDLDIPEQWATFAVNVFGYVCSCWSFVP